ncbi:MAG TPA: hypothetical protein VHU61_13255 [Solirubrobacteraceae bacterium]|nr:hypothetical protein [Solirubrobacteraceae bacterium]
MPSGTPAADSSVGWAPSKLTTETPVEILTQSAAALRKAGSFRLQGTLGATAVISKPMRISAALYPKHVVEISGVELGGRLGIILTGRGAYFRADTSFWSETTHNARAAALLANRWFAYPQGEARKLTRGMSAADPRQIARCMLVGNGKLTLAGYKMVGDQRAIVLHSSPQGPGGQASDIAVAVYGRPYPLQVTALGRPLPGHAKAVPGCGGAGSGAGATDIRTMTLSDFGHLPKLEVPSDAMSVQQYVQHLKSVQADLTPA